MGCEGGGLSTSVVFSFFPNSMTTVIVILAAVITLIICFSVSGKHSISVTALTSPGIIGQHSILGHSFEPDIQMDIAGLVHEFKGGKDHLQEQDLSFQGRTATFADQVMGGNASLELRDVQLSDAGTYQCSEGVGKQSSSIPMVQVENSSHGDTLQCEAPCWFPFPAVHWIAYTGEHLPHAANTSYELNPENITVRVVSLLHNTTANAIYTCLIENSIANAMSNIRVTDFSVTKVTSLQMLSLNAEAVSYSFPACHWMLLLPSYLLST
uniref:V-set domain containing T cell activation inhibitor 1 n=1 Tax=Catharus ustulatus TaxID=91951 RepID=A0A8C3TUN5_CATUS